MRLILFGVDLGTATIEKVRSSDAIGESPREFDIQKAGNLRNTIYTNELLLDGVRVLEGAALFNSDQIEMINCSDGIFIQGFKAMRPDEILDIKDSLEPSSTLTTWWESSPRYSFEMFRSSFIAARPRQYFNETLSQVKDIINQFFNKEDMHTFRKAITQVLHLEGKTRYQEICPRMIRGNVYRILISVNRQLIIMNQADPEIIDKFLDGCRAMLLARISGFKKEVFELLDMLEYNSIDG